jgi:hypothetical protein
MVMVPLQSAVAASFLRARQWSRSDTSNQIAAMLSSGCRLLAKA